jgi:hypothetical protein
VSVAPATMAAQVAGSKWSASRVASSTYRIVSIDGQIAYVSLTTSVKSNLSSVVAKPLPAVMLQTAVIMREYTPAIPMVLGSL